MVDTLDECRRKGYVTTILGRRRSIQGVRPIDQLTLLTDRPAAARSHLPERTAVNSVIQGSAADMIKLAMLAISRRLQEGKVRREHAPANSRRAGLRSRRPKNSTASQRSSATKCETCCHSRVPLKVDVKTGDNWAACE